MAHIGNHSGVQAHSAGENYPYITFLREVWRDGKLISSMIVVTLAGEQLAVTLTWAEGEQLAALFKRMNVRTVADAINAQVADMQAEFDADQFAVSRSEGMKRQRNDYTEMYGDADHVPLTGREVQDWRLAEAEKIRQAETVAAREALELSADDHLDLIEHNYVERDKMLARRALGIIQ